MCNGIDTSLNSLGMILRRAQDERKVLAMAAGQLDGQSGAPGEHFDVRNMKWQV